MQLELNSHKVGSGKMEVSVEGEINAVLANLDAAIRQGDKETIERYYADSICIYDMMPPIEFTDRKEFIKTAWQECFLEAFIFPLAYERHHKQIRIGGSLAFVNNLVHMKGVFKASGEEMETWMRTSLLLENKGGRWQIVHEHNSVPISMEGDKAEFNLPPKELKH